MELIPRFNWVDIIALVVVFRMTYGAYKQGFTQEILPFIGSVVTLGASLTYYAQLGRTISRDLFNLPMSLSFFISFVALASAFGVIFKLLSVLLNKILKMEWQSLIESAGGIVIGAMRAVVATSIIIMVLSLIPASYFSRSVNERSLSGPFFLSVGSEVRDKVGPFLPHISWFGAEGADAGGRATERG